MKVIVTSAFVAISFLAGADALQTDEKLIVDGDVQTRREYTNSTLQKEFTKSVKDLAFSLKGAKGHAHAIRLTTLIESSLERIDSQRKNALLSYAVVVAASDGYSTVFSAGELSPNAGNREVWVALDWNDKPLTKEEGPIRLIVPDDAKPARWVHGVRSIRIVDLSKRVL